jgi:hypothetical protein
MFKIPLEQLGAQLFLPQSKVVLLRVVFLV